MRVLWLTNYPIPFIAKKMNLPVTVNEGWLVSLSDILLQKGFEVIFCCTLDYLNQTIQYTEEKIKFFGINDKNSHR